MKIGFQSSRRSRFVFKQLWHTSFARFLLVGILNTVIGLSCVLVLFNGFGSGYWLSTFIGNTIGGIVSYFLNRKFTFRSEVRFSQSWWKFLLVVCVCYVISFRIGLGIVTGVSPYFPLFSKTLWENAAILIGSGLYTISNYLGHRYFTFSAQSDKRDR